MRAQYTNNGEGLVTATIVVEKGSRADKLGIAEAYGSAQCSPTDHFNRRVGEDIALGRAMKHLGEMVETFGEQNSKTKVEVDALRATRGQKPLYYTPEQAGVSADGKTIEFVLILPGGRQVAIQVPTGPDGDALLHWLTAPMPDGIGGYLSFKP